jgi:hypothetical protein
LTISQALLLVAENVHPDPVVTVTPTLSLRLAGTLALVGDSE